MLLGCGGPSIFFVLPFGFLALFVAVNFPIGLAAMTSALFRRGLDVPVLNKVSRMNFATGLALLVPAIFAWPMVFPAVLLLTMSVVTASANRSAHDLEV